MVGLREKKIKEVPIMGAFQNINTKEYFKRYGYKYGIVRALFTKCPVHLVYDYENQKILYYRKVKKWVQKRLIKYRCADPVGLRFGDIKTNSPIWIYWKQGIENAPDIVKVCIESVKNNIAGDIYIIDDLNLHRYVTFPVYIDERIKNNTISTAAFSDILRFTLLEHFGGTWIDATVFLTDKLPNYITNSKLFAFRDGAGLIKNPALMSVWLLHAERGNQVIREARNICFEYWKYHNSVIEYLLPYIILTTLLEMHPEEYENIPYANSDYNFMLLKSLDKKYNSSEYEHIKLMTNVHKLSYKLKSEVLDDEDNFYHKLVSSLGTSERKGYSLKHY